MWGLRFYYTCLNDICYVQMPPMRVKDMEPHMLDNSQLRAECDMWIERRRAMEINHLTDRSKERNLNFMEDGGGEVLESLFEDKNHLVKKMLGSKDWNLFMTDSKDLNASLVRASSSRIYSFNRDEPFLPLVDWLAALAAGHGRYAWRSISEDSLKRVRETAFMIAYP